MLAEIILNQGIVTRKDSLKGILHIDDPFVGKGEFKLIWTDCLGRTVAIDERTVDINGVNFTFELPLDKGVAMLNYLEAELVLGHRVFTTPRVNFIITPEANKLDDYNIIMYFTYRSEHLAALRKVGITAGQVQSKARLMPAERARAWWEKNFRYYCDQIAIDYYAPYHTPMESPIHRLLLEEKEKYKADRTRKDVFFRKPCFHDEEATAKAMERIRTAVETQMAFKPLFYTTDETGVANLVSAWDFCFDPRTLSAMREWLMEQYGSLEAINEEWGTSFASLDEVVPFTTDEVMERGDDNFSPWADHRHFMNKTFAESVRKGTEEAHAADPEALSGIVGGQMPSAFGGYNYWLLSKAMDIIEPYNIGNNRELWRSFAPDKPALTTSFGFSNNEVWRLWNQALHGDRGIIIYDEHNSYLDEEGNPTKLGQEITPIYKELTNGIIKQLVYADEVNGPVAVHYSHPSITARWMLEVRRMGKDWIERGSSIEANDSNFLRLRESYVKVIEDNLTGYDFVAYEQLENGEFDNMDKKLLLLPQSIAMSKAECDAVRRFVENGGIVVADCRTALMDGHCKMLDKGQLDDLFGIKRSDTGLSWGPEGLEPVEEVPCCMKWAKELTAVGRLDKVKTAEASISLCEGAVALYKDSNGTPAVIVKEHGAGKTIYLNAEITDYHRWRMKPLEGESLKALFKAIFKIADLNNPFKVIDERGNTPHAVELFPFDLGTMKIIGIHRNYQTRVSELGPPEYQDQSVLQKELDLSIDLGGEYAVYDTLSGKYLGKKQKVDFTLDPWKPTLLTLLEAPVEELKIEAPAKVSLGEFAEANFSLMTEVPGKVHTFRAVLIGPDGAEMDALSENILAPEGKASWKIPFALSDCGGEYTIRVRDAATGTIAEHKISVL